MTTPPTSPERQLLETAKRIYVRYEVEVIEAHGFCPWAREARKKGEVDIQIVLGANPTPEQVQTLATNIAQREETLIGLVVMPQVAKTATEFQHFAARVRDAGASRGSPWVIADFHPEGALDTSSAERAVALIRRAPDPTLQFVRHALLEDLRNADGEGTQFLDPSTLNWDTVEKTCPYRPPLAERIATTNLHKLGSVRDQVLTSLEDIHNDRQHSYEATGLEFPVWTQDTG